MSCPICNFNFSKNRKPFVFPCGHSACQDCLAEGENQICPSCKEKGKPVINILVLEGINKRNNESIDKYVKICLFGNMNVGKSSIIRRLVDNEFEYNTNPTIGIDFKYIDQEINGKVCRFQIWDSAGQERYRSTSSHHLKGSDIVLLVYDLSASFQDNCLTYWMSEIENYSQHQNVILIGNKKDLLKNAKSSPKLEDSQMKEMQDIEKVRKPALLETELINIQKSQWTHIEVSCLENDNLDSLWQAILTKSMQHMPHQQVKLKSVILDKSGPKTKGSRVHSSVIANKKKDNCC